MPELGKRFIVKISRGVAPSAAAIQAFAKDAIRAFTLGSSGSGRRIRSYPTNTSRISAIPLSASSMISRTMSPAGFTSRIRPEPVPAM